MTQQQSSVGLGKNGRFYPQQRRRLLIDMALRRIQPGSGSGQHFLQRRTALNPWPDLRHILFGIHWVIVGGVATRAYMPERMTQDLNILIHTQDAETVLSRLQAASYQLVQKLSIPGFLLTSPEGIELDVLLGEQPWIKEALASPAYDLANYPVLPLPYLILLKLEASRVQDIADVTRMLGWASEEMLEKVRQAIAQYAPQESDDLESLVFLGRQERSEP